MLDLNFLFDRGTDIQARANAVWEVLVADEESTANRSPRWKHAERFRYQDIGINHITHSETDLPLEYFGVPELPYIEISYPEDPFEEVIIEDDANIEEPLEKLLDLVRQVYNAVPDLLYGFGITSAHGTQLHEGTVRLPVTEESLANGEIEYAHWLMLFPPRMVETYGRETLLSAPAYHTEALDDGGVLILSSPNPATPAGKEKPIDNHLGLQSPPIDDETQY